MKGEIECIRCEKYTHGMRKCNYVHMSCKECRKKGHTEKQCQEVKQWEDLAKELKIGLEEVFSQYRKYLHQKHWIKRKSEKEKKELIWQEEFL